MMRKILLLMFAVWLTALTASAYDFVYNGIYYKITSTANKTVSVTYKDANFNSYSGSKTIPATVTNSGTTYKVTAIGDSAFFACTDLTSVSIGSNVETIGINAFRNSTSLTSVTLPSSLKTIMKSAFYGCSVLTGITLPSSLNTIGDYAFCRCNGLTSVTIPNSVTSLGQAVFTNCKGLTSATLGSGVTAIKNSLFSDCTNLTSVTIPNSVTSIGDYAFAYCENLPSIDIPNSVTTIGTTAFRQCYAFTSVTIPNSVTSIGSSAFIYCHALTSVTLGSGLTSMSSSVFRDCENLRTIVSLATTPPTIGNATFTSDQYTNAKLFVPEGSLSAYQAAENWSNFTNIREKAFEFMVDGIYYKYSNATNKTASVTYCDTTYNSYSGVVTIPDSVTYNGMTYPVVAIGISAFRACTGLTGVMIPNSVTTIGNYAFQDCDSLTSITIPNSVTYMGMYAFYHCSGLTSLTISNSLTVIYDYVFAYCSSLTSVTIPNSVNTIRYKAFSNCTGLTSVTIPSSVTIIDIAAFQYCSGLTSVTIPNSVTTIGNYAFAECTGLTSVALPNSLTKIEIGIFENCTALTSVNIPSSVTQVSINAFHGCTALTSVMCWATTPPEMNYEASFDDATYSNATLMVPPGSVSAYQAANYWKNFTNIQGLNYDNVLNVEGGTIHFMDFGDYPWTIVNDGSRTYAMSGNKGVSNSSSWLGATITVTKNSTLSFDYLARGANSSSMGQSACVFYVDGVEQFREYNSVRWSSYTVDLSPGEHTVWWCYEKQGGYTNPADDYFAIDNVRVAIKLTYLDYALNIEGGTLQFTTTGSYPWQIIEGGVDGYCGISGNHGVANSSSVLTTTVDVPNGGLLYFIYRAYGDGTTTPSDKCVFEIDGVEQFCYGELDDWEEFQKELSRGTHTLTWSYIKDARYDSDGDFFALDYVYVLEFEPSEGYDFMADGFYYKITGDNTVEVAPGENKYSDDKIIPETVTYQDVTYTVTAIGNGAFGNCVDLTSVEIPNTVTAIGNDAFQGCESLTSVTCLATTPPTIMNSSFDSNTYSNVMLYVPKGCLEAYQAADGWQNFAHIEALHYDFVVNGIYYNHVYNSSTAAEVTYRDSRHNSYSGDVVVPAQVTYEGVTYNVTEIANEAFLRCEGMTSISLPESITAINYGSFNMCSSLTSIMLPNSLTAISSNAFRNCYALTSITIPDNVTGMGTHAFAYCGALTSITIGTNVVNIGANAFEGCDVLSNVTCLATTPPTIQSNTFTSDQYENATLKVPTVSPYQAAEHWQNFLHIEGLNPPGDTNGDGDVNIADVTSLVDLLLTGNATGNPGADVNGDGEVNIGDITALIDFLLSGNWP